MILQENKTGKWIALAISLPLSAFTIWRAWDIMTAILPASQALAAVFGIAALDGGMIGWIFGYMNAQSSDQRRAAAIAAFCDFIGVGLVTFVDLMQNGVAKGLVQSPANLFLAAIILISVAVVLNIGFGWLYVLGDPKKKQEIRDQKAHDTINDMADAYIAQNSQMFAPAFAQVRVQQWLHQASMIHNVGPIAGIAQNQTIESLPSPSMPQMQPMSHAQVASPSDQKGWLDRLGDALKRPPSPTQPPLSIDYSQLAQAMIAAQQQPPIPVATQPDPLAYPSLVPTAKPTTENSNGNGSH